MELRHLRYFVAVAEMLHFGRAARRLGITQPTLSQQIQKLEQEIGVQLFDRTSRRVRLTSAGEVFLRRARPILAQTHDALREAYRIGQGEAGHLRVAFVGPAMDSLLPPIIRTFRDAHPAIRMTLERMTTREILQAVASERIDLGVGRLFQGGPPEVESRPVLTSTYVLAVPESHPLAGDTPLSFKALDGHRLIFYPRHQHPALYDACWNVLRRAEAAPHVVQEVTTKRTALALVATGLGCAIVPALHAEKPQPGVSFRRLESGLPPVVLSAIWSARSVNPLVTRLLNILPAPRATSAP